LSLRMCKIKNPADNNGDRTLEEIGIPPRVGRKLAPQIVRIDTQYPSFWIL